MKNGGRKIIREQIVKSVKKEAGQEIEVANSKSKDGRPTLEPIDVSHKKKPWQEGQKKKRSFKK